MRVGPSPEQSDPVQQGNDLSSIGSFLRAIAINLSAKEKDLWANTLDLLRV